MSDKCKCCGKPLDYHDIPDEGLESDSEDSVSECPQQDVCGDAVIDERTKMCKYYDSDHDDCNWEFENMEEIN